MDNTSIEEKMRFIGIRITGGESKKINLKSEWIDIEQTIYESSFKAEGDARVFFVLCAWVKIHGEYAIIEKLMNLQKKRNSVWLVALALYAVRFGHLKWSRLIKKVKGEFSLSTIALARQQIEYKGADEDFVKLGFLIAKNGLRIRDQDVFSQEELIKANRQYSNRYVFGANLRADIILAIDLGIENPYRIAKLLGCTYTPAYRIFNDYKMATRVKAS